MPSLKQSNTEPSATDALQQFLLNATEEFLKEKKFFPHYCQLLSQYRCQIKERSEGKIISLGQKITVTVNNGRDLKNQPEYKNDYRYQNVNEFKIKIFLGHIDGVLQKHLLVGTHNNQVFYVYEAAN